MENVTGLFSLLKKPNQNKIHRNQQKSPTPLDRNRSPDASLVTFLSHDMSGHSTGQLVVAQLKSIFHGKQGQSRMDHSLWESDSNFTKGRGCPWPHYLQTVTWTSRKGDILGALTLYFIYTIRQCQGKTAHRQAEGLSRKIQEPNQNFCCSTLFYLFILLFHRYSSVKLTSVFHLCFVLTTITPMDSIHTS